MKNELHDAIAHIESRFFRTEHDSGAGGNALMIWNALRQPAGLDSVQLPEWCDNCREYHNGHCKPLVDLLAIKRTSVP